MLIDIIAIVISLACVVHGIKKGLVKTLFGTLSLLVALLLTSLTLPAFTAWMTDTPLGEAVYEKTQISIVGSYREGTDAGILCEFLEKAGISALSEAEKEASVYLGNMMIRALSACVLFVGYSLLLRLLAKLLDIAAKLPILHTFNKLGGLAFGAVNAFLLLTVFAWIFLFVSPVSSQAFLQEQMETSRVMLWFMKVNPFL